MPGGARRGDTVRSARVPSFGWRPAPRDACSRPCRSWVLSSAVAPVLIARGDPLLGEDRGAERELAAEHGGGYDLRELPDVPLAVAAEKVEALLLGREAGAAAVGGDDQRGHRDRVVVVAVLLHLGVDRGGGRLRDVRDVLP